LRREFEVYGPIKKVRICSNIWMDTYEVQSSLFLDDLQANAMETTHCCVLFTSDILGGGVCLFIFLPPLIFFYFSIGVNVCLFRCNISYMYVFNRGTR